MSTSQIRYLVAARVFMLVMVMLWLCHGVVEARQMPTSDIDTVIAKGEEAFLDERYSDALRLFMKAKNMAEKADSFRLNCVATYDMGVCYFMISENGEALKYYYEALTIAEKYRLGRESRSKIQNGIAGVYFEENNFDKAEELCLACYDDAVHERDSASCVTYCMDLGLIYNKKKRFGLTEKYLKECMSWAKGSSDSSIYYKVGLTKLEMLYLQKRYDEVLKQGEPLCQTPYLTNSDKTVTMTYLIDIYKERGQLDKAFRLAEQASRIATLRNRSHLCESIAQLYKAQGNMTEALNYKDSVIVYSDSLMRIQDRRLTENSRIKIEVYKMRSEMEGELSRLTQHRQLSYLFITICVLLMVIGVLMYRSQRQKSRQHAQQMQLQIEQEKNDKLVVEQRMRETELVAHYQEEMLTKEIEQKKRELSTMTMFVASRNALITDLLASISDMKGSKESQQLAALANHLTQMLKDSGEHDKFLIDFEAAYPDFSVALTQKHPELSASDIRFLTYVRMNLSAKEIAVFMNVEPESCKRRKNRIAKKLGLDSSADLYQYVCQY